MYDREVINVLLNNARRHLATTFGIYANFEATVDTSHELCLAMAAVGGLFSSVEGSTTVAKALYNDARRIHLEKAIIRPRGVTFTAALSRVKTFVLLTIYGICSGDKRSYEFAEVHHFSTMQAMDYCWQIAPLELSPAQDLELSLLAEALDIIQSYQVLLLQRPPYFPSTSSRRHRPSLSKHDLAPLLTPPDQVNKIAGSLREVAALGAYAWTSVPSSQVFSREWQLWRPEFVELALERWREALETSKRMELSPLLFYHLIHLHLQTNLGVLQRFARKFITLPETSHDKKIFEMLCQCTCGRPFTAAVWHAKAMLRLIREHITVPSRSQLKASDKFQALEPPHLPYCIYFATLIVWYHEYTSSGLYSLARNVCIENGIHLLEMLKVRVAKVLANTLRELFPDENSLEI